MRRKKKNFLDYKVSFIETSRNAKIGKISATYTSSNSCPVSCPFKGCGCYAGYGPCAMHWQAVTSGKSGGLLKDLQKQVEEKECRQIVRLNVAGDMAYPSTSKFNFNLLEVYEEVFRGKTVYTYTHCGLSSEDAKRLAQSFIVVSKSCESLEQVKRYLLLGVPCVLAVASMKTPSREIDSVKLVKCPNQ